MTWRYQSLLPVVLALGLLIPPASTQEEERGSALPTVAPGTNFQPSDVAYPHSLPAIGKWMISPDGTIAHWLGETVDGKALREPINLIIIDSISADPEQAKRRLQAASRAAGYPIRFGHSTGYRALIGGEMFPQLPQGRDDAFSNEIFEVNNNHGRLFGPYRSDLGHLFIGAFSREEIRIFETPRHGYASFNEARDDYSQRLDFETEFKLSGFVNLDNAIVDDPHVGTGDHDGVAVLLRTNPANSR